MKIFLGVCMVLVMVTFLFVPEFYAQDDFDDSDDFFYGEIIDVYPGSITVRGSDIDPFSEEGFEEMTFTVSEDSGIENLGEGEMLKAGMEVDVEYDMEGGERRAERIYVYND